VVEVDTLTGARSYHHFASEREAEAKAADLRPAAARQNGATTAQVFALYEEHLTEKGNKTRSIATTVYRVQLLLAPLMGRALVSVSRQDTGRAVHRLADLAPDSRLNIAAEARTFLRWCLSAGHLTEDVTPDLKVQARRRRGKPQLRIDEARKWLGVALDLANNGHAGAAGAAMTLLMGMRASEIADRTVRDLDDGGSLLWIPQAKTRAGVRRLRVPAVLQAALLTLVKGRPSHAKLFDGATRYWVDYHVKRLCRLANVPRVCAHGMRGLHATLATDADVTADQVARALGHDSFTTTERHLRSR
jgi:integrase